MSKKYKVLDLFSGAGGLSLGLELSNSFKTVAAVDHWKPAIETYSYNNPKVNTIEYNLELTYDDKGAEDLIKKIDYNNDIDLIVGGPPCQGMSMAGKRLANDSRNNLFKSFVKLVELLQPKMFLMENVPGLLSSGNIYNGIINSFNSINYNIFNANNPKIFKAEMYGVPQMRRRLFILGINNKYPFSDESWFPKETHKEYKKNRQDINLKLFGDDLKDFVNCKTALYGLPEIKSGEGDDILDYPKNIDFNVKDEFLKHVLSWNSNKNIDKKIYNHKAPNHTEKMLKMIKKTEPGTQVDPKYSDSKKLHPQAPSYTVKALGAGGGSTNRRAFHFDSKFSRGTTVRENARFQSFPDWYVFRSAPTNQMSLVGNAVPPLLAKSIGKSISSILKNL